MDKESISKIKKAVLIGNLIRKYDIKIAFMALDVIDEASKTMGPDDINSVGECIGEIARHFKKTEETIEENNLTDLDGEK